MSLNIMDNYIKYTKKKITKYASMCLDNFYNKKIFAYLLDKYIDLRYYDVDNYITSKNAVIYLNKELVKRAKSYHEEKIENMEENLYFFGIVYHLDNVVTDDSLEKIASMINAYRTNDLDLKALPEKDLIKELMSDEATEEKYFETFDDKYFTLDIKKLRNKYYDTKLKYNLEFPKLYSNYAIDNAFNEGVIGENKTFIEYYMVTNIILKEIKELNFSNNYLVDFPISILEKKDKQNRMFNIIEDDLMKDKIIFKIKYEDYKKITDEVNDFISDGYNFAIIVKASDKLSSSEKNKLQLFRIVLTDIKELKNEIDTIVINY